MAKKLVKIGGKLLVSHHGRVKVHRVLKAKEIQIVYGFLYNRYAVVNEPGIARSPFRAPSEDDANILRSYIEDNYNIAPDDFGVGCHLKSERIAVGDPEVGISTNVHPRWDYHETAYGRDTVNFNSVPGGTRGGGNGVFYYIGRQSDIWLTTIGASGNEGRTLVFTHNSTTAVVTGNRGFRTGYSVRLVRDATVDEQVLSDGTYLTDYIGNDLRLYKTVKIGTQVWTAENLCETKNNNGDNIPEVIDATDWNNLTTGARCSYDNDTNNSFIYT